MPYISKIQLPTGTSYDIKDQEARDLIAELMNYTHYLGVTTTAINDDDTAGNIVIGSVTWTKGATYSEENHVYTTGCIVTANTATSYTQDEFICNSDGKWQRFGNLGALGALAYKNSAITNKDVITGIGSSAITYAYDISSITDPTITITPTSANINVNVPSGTWLTDVSYSKAIGFSYAKATGGTYTAITGATVTVDSSATFTGATDVSVATAISGGTGTTNLSTTLLLHSATGGLSIVSKLESRAANATDALTNYVYGISSATATGGAVTVGPATVYGLENSITTYMTGSETLSKVSAAVFSAVSSTTAVSAVYATMDSNETLVLSLVTPLDSITFSTYSVLSDTTSLVAGDSSTAKEYIVGASGSTTFTQPTITVTPSVSSLFVISGNYKVDVPANTWVASVTPASGTFSNVAVTVSGSAVTASDVSLISDTAAIALTSETASATDITYSETAARLIKNTATTLAIQSSTTGYGVITGITSASASGTAVVLSTSTASAITSITKESVYSS